MKKSLLFLFLLVLGVTQGWAQGTYTAPTYKTTFPTNGNLVKNYVYKVESSQTISSTLTAPTDGPVTIYIAKGKTLTVKGNVGSATTAAKPAISVPTGAILIVTGGGTLRVYGGKAGLRNGGTTRNPNPNGGGGAAPAIGGAGGKGGTGTTTGSKAGDGSGMGTVYIRGNVTVRAARGTSGGRRATTNYGADGLVPTYAIGGGGAGGAYKGDTQSNYKNGGLGTLYIENTARVLYLNGSKRKFDKENTIKMTTPNNVVVTFDANEGKISGQTSTTLTQTIREFGKINVNNKLFTRQSVTETVNADGFKVVTNYSLAGWQDEKGNTYSVNDFVIANGNGNGINSTLTLKAKWTETESLYAIYTADDLMKFAKYVNETPKLDANGILMADIDMKQRSASWGYWIPIGGTSKVQDKATNTNLNTVKPFRGVFDGNGHIVANLEMENLAWDAAYGRVGLIGYAYGATIKNVIVKNATLYGKWQVGAVCGRLDRVNSKGTIDNCGSFGNLDLHAVATDDVKDRTNEAFNARIVAGITTTDPANVNYIKSVWSTYSGKRFDAPEYDPKHPEQTEVPWQTSENYVVGTWNSSSNNTTYYNYTRNAGSTTGDDKKWVYVPSDKIITWLVNGDLCYQVNGDPSNGVTWTQTFNEEDKNDANRDYVECPRPTTEGLAVYQDGTTYYNRIWTISFDPNGGNESECPDMYVTRNYNASSRNYPVLPSLEDIEDSESKLTYKFDVWSKLLDSGEEQIVTEENKSAVINSDITLYAKWLAGPKSITVKAVEDANKPGNYYSTFYYGEQNYQIGTDNVVAYKAYREMENGVVSGNNLVMMTLKDKQHISKVIPAGEAVILKANGTPKQGSLIINLTAVSSSEDDPELDENNILYGTDEQINVTDVNDMITTNEKIADDVDAQTYSNCYVFAFGSNTGLLGFYKPSGNTLAAHKAYALLNDQIIVPVNTGSGSAKAESLQMIFEDDEEQVTGISEHKSESETKKAIFSINGMPLSKLQKGINIVGGKKVFVK